MRVGPRRWHIEAALFAVATVLVSTDAAAQAGNAAAGVGAATAAPEDGRIWRGTGVSYQQGLSAISLNKDFQGTWNPEYSQTLAISPTLHFGGLTASLFMNFSQEMTNSDDTKYLHEIVLSDAVFNFSGGYREPTTGLSFGGGLQIVAPLSKVSQARTLVTALRPGLNVSRNFKVLEGLNLRYSSRFAWNFNRFTTAQFDESPIPGCNVEIDPLCARLQSTGQRNVQYAITHGPGASISLTPTLSLSADFSMIRGRTYDQGDAVEHTLTGDVVIHGNEGVMWRYIDYFTMSASWQAMDSVSVDFGAFAFYQELAPNGQYQTPFFNRFSTLFVSFSVDLESATRPSKPSP